MGERSPTRRAPFPIRFIRVYQEHVSSRLGARCSGEESCSDYALRMFEQHRYPLASTKTLIRIVRCRPPQASGSTRMRAGRTRRAFALTGLLGILALTGTLFLSGPASADVSQGCYGNAGGRRFDSITRASPLKVRLSTRIPLAGGANAPVDKYQVTISYFGIQFAGREGSTSQNRWTGSFRASQFATRGTGHYIIRGYVSRGGNLYCFAYLYIDVEGDPLGSPMGQAAAGLTLAGLGGMLVTAVTGGKAPPGFESTTTPADEEEIKRLQEEEEKREAQRREDEENSKLAQEASRKLCFFLAFPALLMTAGVMASGGGNTGATRSFPRVPWRPRLSIVGIGSGVLFGAGSGVLLQQYGVIWPTLGMGIAFLVGGLALGVLVPTLGRLRSVRKMNRRMDAFEARWGPPRWVATHRAPNDGLSVWAQPDPSAEPTRSIESGTAVQLAETRGDWAEVVGATGWRGWVDARQLEAFVPSQTEATPEPPAEVAGTDEAEDAAIPADWYPDPSGEARLRYWDGSSWTEHVAD